MHKRHTYFYLSPFLLHQSELLLEVSLLAASVVDTTTPVETAGQKIDDIYDGTNTTSTGSAFNYEWGD